MDHKPDTIKITAFHREEIFASHANLFVSVKGSSVVSGDQAMKKAKEVSGLVEALIRFGLSTDALQLLGVHIETSSEKVASAMGVKLLGVYDFVENTFDEERPAPFQAQALIMRKAGGAEAADEPNLNMDIQHSKTIQVNVEIWYRVSSF